MAPVGTLASTAAHVTAVAPSIGVHAVHVSEAEVALLSVT